MNEELIKYNLKKNLQRIRKANNFRQEDIANAIGVERSTYSSWELGRSMPKPSQLAMMSEMFNCSVDFLIKNDNEHAFRLNNKLPYDTGKVYGDSYVSELNDEERAFLLKFRLLNSKDKEQLDEFIDNIRNTKE